MLNFKKKIQHHNNQRKMGQNNRETSNWTIFNHELTLMM